MPIQASCTDLSDSVYDLLVSQGDYGKAFDRVAQEVHLSAADKLHFDIVSGYSASHDDRNGQADPDTLQIHLDPNLFMEGKEGACQGVAHELTHLHQFQQDRKAVSDQDAYDRLEDNDLVAHDAAMEIEAVLAQLPYATHHLLRDDDLDYLQEKLTAWATHQTMITDSSNEIFYPRPVKHRDIQLFCRGADYAGRVGLTNMVWGSARAKFCRGHQGT